MKSEPDYFDDRSEHAPTRLHNKRKKNKKTKKTTQRSRKNEAKAKRQSEKKLRRRFVKVRDESSSLSRERPKGKPVDIIVHIKMNESCLFYSFLIHTLNEYCPFERCERSFRFDLVASLCLNNLFCFGSILKREKVL